ncbi:hypothetical protein BN2476_1530007 [Paraburkholderia piptadeniae]|uniref:Uncharacterized protein n=1 Tax=Paraburkholderia piptadeniae TaxID=1701573 RepID=A0A1N7SWR3_9BURK|nr:hypothetical protein BN2476_1530007 [Paraburkholderia piptadeniae]
MSQRRPKPGSNRLDTAVADRAISIIRDRCVDFGANAGLREVL